MNFKYNGKIISTKDKITLQNFVSGLDLPKLYALELNGKIIYKEQYEEIIINENDEIELVTFTGGG